MEGHVVVQWGHDLSHRQAGSEEACLSEKKD
jgi:hypothetical protein